MDMEDTRSASKKIDLSTPLRILQSRDLTAILELYERLAFNSIEDSSAQQFRVLLSRFLFLFVSLSWLFVSVFLFVPAFAGLSWYLRGNHTEWESSKDV